ncbi:helix-turn-helix domain-containing protein [Brevibacterium sp. 91QC2O2]|uniref:helix-turn-helix domain-containing protein n=1 Tax=Brevibacterium sp. 91QC2O2 TaxID=2968458 RepID=UPI00359C565B
MCTARKNAGLTQGQLAHKAGVGMRFIIDMESGHARAELGKVLVLAENIGLQLSLQPMTAEKVQAIGLPSERPQSTYPSQVYH